MNIRIRMTGENYEEEVCLLIRAFLPEAIFLKQEDTKSPADWECFFELQADSMTFRIENADGVLYREACGYDKEGELPEKGPSDAARRAYRNELLRLVYRGMSKTTGRTLPWGFLTGVRPVKLVYEKLSVMSEEQIAEYMKREYYCSDEKIEVSLTVAKREKELLTQLHPERGYSLYIGIPFCPTTCLYCSFTSYPLEKYSACVEPYLNALKRELAFTAEYLSGKSPMSIYIGGGTPTTLTAGQLRDLIGYTKTLFDFSGVKEFTVEAGRPDSLNEEKLRALKELGVSRISINPQTMCQETLDLIGRRHTTEQIEEAVAFARQAGHDNINMDLIIGLTGETPGHVERTLSRIRPLNPESLTVHTLALKRAARLNLERERYKDRKAVDVVQMQKLTAAYAKEHGYLPYYLYRQKNMAENLENVGYAKYGRECLYNIAIMEEQQTILALGAGGLSKFYFPSENRLERVENVKSLKDYIERVEEMIERKHGFMEKNRMLLEQTILKEGSGG